MYMWIPQQGPCSVTCGEGEAAVLNLYGDLGRILVWLAGSLPDLYSMGSPGLTERHVTSVIDT